MSPGSRASGVHGRNVQRKRRHRGEHQACDADNSGEAKGSFESDGATVVGKLATPGR